MHFQSNERILPMRTTFISLLVAGVAISLGAPGASAETAGPQVHKHHHAVPHYVRDTSEALPLTVNRRSFLDPGPAVPVGSENAYVSANTIYVKTPDQVSNTARFGNSTLMSTPDVGHAAPVAEFATGPNVGDLYAGPLFNIGQ
jgi:hypothetical protein